MGAVKWSQKRAIISATDGPNIEIRIKFFAEKNVLAVEFHYNKILLAARSFVTQMTCSCWRGVTRGGVLAVVNMTGLHCVRN